MLKASDDNEGGTKMIGLIGAMDIEVNGIIEKMTDTASETISGINFTRGRLGGTECVAAKSGIGKVNAAVCAQTMIMRYDPECIINTGIAGSTCEKTHIGCVVIARAVVQHDMDTTIIGDRPGELFLPDESIIEIPCSEELIKRLEAACHSIGENNRVTGIIATGDQFIGGNERRAALNDRFGAIACEMEGGSIGQVCRINNLPFAVLRCISDSMSSEDDGIEYSSFSRLAADKSVQIITAFVQSANVLF